MKNLLLKITNRLLVILAVAGLFVFSGCGDDDQEGPTQTVWQIIESRDDLSALEGELEAAGLADMLADESADLTVFAPNNPALSSLLNLLGETDFSNVAPEVVDDVLTFHVVNQRLSQSEVTGTITTSQGEVITVTDEAGLSSGASSDANIVLSIEGTNGIVHIVSAVLLPPSYEIIAAAVGTSAQIILLAADYSIFATAIKMVDATKTDPATTITGALIGMETTVFAIPNQVFEAASITANTYSAEQWEGIIKKHIIVGEKIDPLPADAVRSNFAGTELVINGTSTPPTVNQIPIIVANKKSVTSGVVYPIGGMIQ